MTLRLEAQGAIDHGAFAALVGQGLSLLGLGVQADPRVRATAW